MMVSVTASAPVRSAAVSGAGEGSASDETEPSERVSSERGN